MRGFRIGVSCLGIAWEWRREGESDVGSPVTCYGESKGFRMKITCVSGFTCV